MEQQAGILRRDSLLIFLTGIAVFTVGLSPEFVGLQARFALFAQNMLRSGPTFFPLTYMGPYADYPAASTLLTVLASLPAGRVTPFSTVLPTALASACILVATYRIGALRSRLWGLYGVLFALCTLTFLGEGRTVSLDQYTSLATALSFYTAISAVLSRRRGRLALLPLFWAAGFAFRGPIGLIVPAGVVCGTFLFAREFRLLLLAALSAAALLALCGKALLFGARLQGGEDLVREVVYAQASSRMGSDVEESVFSFYGFTAFAFYAVSYPVALLVIGSRLRPIFRRGERDFRLLGALAVWIAVVIVGMSVPGTKTKARYVLPMVPAAALAAGYLFLDPSRRGVLHWARRAFLRLCVLFPALAFLGVLVAYAVSRCVEPRLDAPYFQTAVFLLLLSVVARGLYTAFKESPARRSLAGMGVAAAALVVLQLGLIDPMYYSRERTAPFVEAMRGLQARSPRPIVFYSLGPDAEDLKFMANYGTPARPEFVASPEALLRQGGEAYFIVRERDTADIPPAVARAMEILHRGRIGHRECVVFALREGGGILDLGAAE